MCTARLAVSRPSKDGQDQGADFIDVVSYSDRGLLIQVANALSAARAPRPQVAELLERVVAGGPLDDLPPYGLAASWAVPALACAGDLELARRVADQAHATARRRGSVYDVGKATFCLAVVEYLLGQLDQAVHQAMVAVELARSGVTSILAWGSAVLCLAHLERGDLVAADKAVRIGECTDHTRVSYGMVLEARARLDLAQGRPAAALADAVTARDALARHHLVDYPLAAWRLPAAVAAAALGRLDEARGLADEELALSRASLSPPQLGAALTVRGRIECGERQLPFLRDAVDALEGTEPGSCRPRRATTSVLPSGSTVTRSLLVPHSCVRWSSLPPAGRWSWRRRPVASFISSASVPAALHAKGSPPHFERAASGGARRRWRHQPADRGASLHHEEHRRVPSHPDLPEARARLTSRARATVRAAARLVTDGDDYRSPVPTSARPGAEPAPETVQMRRERARPSPANATERPARAGTTVSSRPGCGYRHLPYLSSTWSRTLGPGSAQPPA